VPVSVTQTDVETALVRPLTSTEAQFVDGLCEQAIAKLTAALPSIDARVAAYEADATTPAGINPALVTSVLATVVKRVLVNPQGAWSATQAVGPKSQSVTFGGGRAGGAVDAPGALAITPGDIDEILGRSAFAVPGTIRTRPPRPDGCW
jgi:hypothetical protein